MPPYQDQPHNGNPTPAEIFRLFRNTTLASIEALRLLLVECADLRADLITVHELQSDGDGDGVFLGRQRGRIQELQNAALEMASLLASLPGGKPRDDMEQQ